MKKLISLAILVLTPIILMAQTDESLDSEFGGRLSISVDKKLNRGLHLTAQEELRMDNNFGSLDRLQTNIGLTYKATDILKLGVGAAMINHYDADDSKFDNTRFRLMLDATVGTLAGAWRFSLKERLQLTLRTGDFNPYQNPTLGVSLKSRLKAQYKGWRRVEPYAYVEMRNVLFAPVVAACYDTTTALYYTTSGDEYGDAGWFIDSYTGGYINRLRGSIGIDWRLDRRNKIGLAVLADYTMDRVIDANSEGTALKSYSRQTGFSGWIVAEYTILL